MALTDAVKEYIRSVNKIKTQVSKTPKKLSGYNLFCQEQRSGLTGTSVEIMKQLGSLWRESDEKEVYNARAKKAPSKAAPAVSSEPDVQVEELKAAIAETIKNFKKAQQKADKKAKKEAEVALGCGEDHSADPVSEPEVPASEPEAAAPEAPAKKVRAKKAKKETA